MNADYLVSLFTGIQRELLSLVEESGHGTRCLRKAGREGWAVNQVFGKVYPTAKARIPQTITAEKKAVGELVTENGAGTRLALSQAVRAGAEHLGGWKGVRW